MIGRTNAGGGGGGLNFKVVGGSAQPGNPKENTIWVNTDTEITGWAFSATEPDSPVEGMVWFFTQKNSPVSMNALRKNSIMVYPTAAYQYVSGVWVSKTAMSYIGGQWLDFVLYLYDTGDECIDVTGGWVSKAMRRTSGDAATAAAPSIKRGDTTIKASLTTSAVSGIFYAANKIDLTNLKMLTLKGTLYNASGDPYCMRMCVWSALGTYADTNTVAMRSITSQTILHSATLDVTKATGECVVGFLINTNGGRGVTSYVEIEQLYLS